MPRLTDLSLKALKPKASSYLKSDGDGLNIKVYPNGRMQWLLRKSSQGKANQIVLGEYPAMSLKQAREQASLEASKFIDARCYVAPKTSMTFLELFNEWLAAKDGLRANSILLYKQVCRNLEPFHNRAIESITPMEVKRLAETISKTTPSIVGRVVNTIASVEIYANALGLIEVPKLQFVSKTLKPYKGDHNRSIHYEQLPKVFEVASAVKSRRKEYYCYLLLLGMLTLLRTHELQSLKRDWINQDDGVIYLPDSVMKAKRPHTVPICKQLNFLLDNFGKFDLIASRCEEDTNLVQRFSNIFSLMHLTPIMTPHGMRSLARTWFADQDFNFAAAEMCLAHMVENATQQAYQRSDYLKQRRVIMQAWGDYVEKCARPYLPQFFQ